MDQGEQEYTLKDVLTAVEELKALGDAVKARQITLRQTVRLLKVSVIDDGQDVPFLFEFHWDIKSIAEINDAICGRSFHEASDVLDMIYEANRFGLKLHMPPVTIPQ